MTLNRKKYEVWVAYAEPWTPDLECPDDEVFAADEYRAAETYACRENPIDSDLAIVLRDVETNRMYEVDLTQRWEVDSLKDYPR